VATAVQSVMATAVQSVVATSVQSVVATAVQTLPDSRCGRSGSGVLELCFS
jgi:hypothetical protein